MNTRNDTHPSELCGCDTCELEHQYHPDETALRVAVNPNSGTIVALEPIDDNDGWVVTCTNHRTDGTVLFGWRAYDNMGDAFHCFWQIAEWAPE